MDAESSWGASVMNSVVLQVERKRAALRASTCSSRQVESLPTYSEEKKQDVSDEKITQRNVST